MKKEGSDDPEVSRRDFVKATVGSRKGQPVSFVEQPSQPTQHSVPGVGNLRNNT